MFSILGLPVLLSVQVSGNSRDYNVDLSPKFLLSAGDLVKMLLRTGVQASHLFFFPVLRAVSICEIYQR